ncbi:MAG: hypothetical protein P4L26_00610 [Terracidiphilus sp.]|nr:hypothetical protein [Terracidiphilus sp.]
MEKFVDYFPQISTQIPFSFACQQEQGSDMRIKPFNINEQSKRRGRAQIAAQALNRALQF